MLLSFFAPTAIFSPENVIVKLVTAVEKRLVNSGVNDVVIDPNAEGYFSSVRSWRYVCGWSRFDLWD